jgi:hypothetical protein
MMRGIILGIGTIAISVVGFVAIVIYLPSLWWVPAFFAGIMFTTFFAVLVFLCLRISHLSRHAPRKDLVNPFRRRSVVLSLNQLALALTGAMRERDYVDPRHNPNGGASEPWNNPENGVF